MGKKQAPEHADRDSRLGRKEYEAALEPMQLELAQMSRWLAHHHKRLLVIFEGRDTAGKSGVIRAISEVLDPRRCQVVALGKPSDTERGQWYFQRYVQHLPAAGNVTLFDRSWYNRAGVEHVMGFCTPRRRRARHGVLHRRRVPALPQGGAPVRAHAD